jgi:hypothetical protein
LKRSEQEASNFQAQEQAYELNKNTTLQVVCMEASMHAIRRIVAVVLAYPR